MKSTEIKEAALKYFTIHGYEGASLAQIAEEVGLKKQSIYSHFSGKDDLFMQVLRDAKDIELSSKSDYIFKMDTQNPEKELYGYLKLVIDLFQKDEHLKFWLRMSFFPPAHLRETIGTEVMDIEEKVKNMLETKFQYWLDEKMIVADMAKIPTIAFLGIVDSIMVELVYCDLEQQLQDKLEASWSIFWRGITK